ncbi:MAG TPA: hypothetical protein DCY97_04125 [Marinilabiliales bacterium]|jgi:hypothetical protein|nr:MAG: hypothetical protein A2W84_07400 [Bacteroidetes bacterium GWC2_40_13]HAZ01350.1 hypothetical protein [Marinilabiliales bacterium]
MAVVISAASYMAPITTGTDEAPGKFCTTTAIEYETARNPACTKSWVTEEAVPDLTKAAKRNLHTYC